MADLDLVFWPAPVRRHPFEAHVRAAAAGGFTALAIAATTYAEARARGLSAACSASPRMAGARHERMAGRVSRMEGVARL